MLTLKARNAWLIITLWKKQQIPKTTIESITKTSNVNVITTATADYKRQWNSDDGCTYHSVRASCSVHIQKQPAISFSAHRHSLMISHTPEYTHYTATHIDSICCYSTVFRWKFIIARIGKMVYDVIINCPLCVWRETSETDGGGGGGGSSE